MKIINHFITGQEITVPELQQLLATAQQQKAKPELYQSLLAGKSVVTLFEKPSLRTRISFDVGLQKLGGHAIYLDEQGKGLGVRESIADYAKNLSCWCDAIVARVLEHDTLTALAEYASVPVINSLCDQFHPCQALADCLTLQETFGQVHGLHIVYSGDGNNVARSLALYCAMLGAKVTVVTPADKSLNENWVQQVNQQYAGQVVSATSFEKVDSADVIYTDTWVSMGDDTPLDEVCECFMPYQVNAELMNALSPRYVMHCQPAHRGYEITAEVMDGEQSLCLQQATNRLYAQNALLTQLLAPAALFSDNSLRNAS